MTTTMTETELMQHVLGLDFSGTAEEFANRIDSRFLATVLKLDIKKRQDITYVVVGLLALRRLAIDEPKIHKEMLALASRNSNNSASTHMVAAALASLKIVLLARTGVVTIQEPKPTSFFPPAHLVQIVSGREEEFMRAFETDPERKGMDREMSILSALQLARN